MQQKVSDYHQEKQKNDVSVNHEKQKTSLSVDQFHKTETFLFSDTISLHKRRAILQRPEQGHFVGIFQRSANRQPERQTRH